MQALPTDALPLVALAFVLGAKHGLDADHLVAIDGLTRFNAAERPGLARWCGVLFSMGHGAVVIGVALMVGIATDRWIVPTWLEATGAWISIGFLTALGMMNLLAVLSAPAESVVQPIGFKAGWLGRVMQTSSPASIFAVGALFALSFDTVSQAALFALTASQISDVALGVGAATAFMIGMMTADGINGIWIASLLRNADRRARVATRVMGLAVAGLSLCVAALGAAKLVSDGVDQWFDGRELEIGLAVVAAVAASFLLAVLLSRPVKSASQTPL
jgi:nickel/cobalt transporter (NiCoT) family protein